MTDTEETKELVKSITEEFPRYEPENKLNYSKLELIEKERWIKEAKKDYPNLPEQFIAWAIDYRKILGDDKFNEMIEAGEFSKSANPRDVPTVLMNGTIENPEDTKKVIN